MIVAMVVLVAGLWLRSGEDTEERAIQLTDAAEVEQQEALAALEAEQRATRRDRSAHTSCDRRLTCVGHRDHRHFDTPAADEALLACS